MADDTGTWQGPIPNPNPGVWYYSKTSNMTTRLPYPFPEDLLAYPWHREAEWTLCHEQQPPYTGQSWIYSRITHKWYIDDFGDAHQEWLDWVAEQNKEN